MKTRFLKVQIIVLFMSLILSFASFFIFQKDGCGPPYDGGGTNRAPIVDVTDAPYCTEWGFPVVLKSGGFSDTRPAEGFPTAFIGNSVFYFLLLNLLYLVVSKVKKT
ncbi:MAG: hypothetical protein WD231_01025 [Candidatus Woykebacteria bacterium]